MIPYHLMLFSCAFAGKNPFGPRLSIAEFASKFLLSNQEVVANKQKRFTAYLKKAADGTLLHRPDVNVPYVAHMTYHKPMWGVLQSSYADVEKELEVMREQHKDKRILFVGGDGLSIIRMNHLLLQRPERYIDSTPLIIPVQGEAPHGVFHVMHGGWRLYSRFIRAAADATLGIELAKAVVDEPTVKVFNTQIYALWWMTRACSEYLLLLSRTPGAPSIDQPAEFIAECEKNVDLAWVAHFLYDFAYLVLNFKQEVRANRSKHIDVLWREFFSVGNTGTANKTNYVPMAIMRIFWADALAPDLAHLYHNLRAIPMSKRVFVGWDTPIEWLNGAITDGVRQLVSDARIEEFVANYSLMNHTYASLLDVLEVLHGGNGTSHMKDMSSNVDEMKKWLVDKVGKDWATATVRNRSTKLGIKRGVLPWVEVRESISQPGADSVPATICRHVRHLTKTFYAFR